MNLNSSKVGVLQSFVQDLSEQNEVLIQALEAREAESRVVERRAASMHKELEKLDKREEPLLQLQSDSLSERRLSLALCPLPADFVGTTTMFLRTLGDHADRDKDMHTQLPNQDPLLQKLKKACLSQLEAQAAVKEREAQVQELQDTITELHQEMTRKDQDKLKQLQELHQLKSRVKLLSEQASTTDQTASCQAHHLPQQKSTELLKTELSRRDATIQRLRRDVLLSHQARDSQTAQLDVQEQRISQLQTELQQSQLEFQRGRSHREQQLRDLQTQTELTEELHTQLVEVKGRLEQVEGENEALMGFKRQLESEVERLAAEVCSPQSTARTREDTQSTQAEQRSTGQQLELAETHAQLTECLDRLHVPQRMAEEQTQQVQSELFSLKSQHGCVRQQLQDRTAELQGLQKSVAMLHGREVQWDRERSALQSEQGDGQQPLIGDLQRELDRQTNLSVRAKQQQVVGQQVQCLRYNPTQREDDIEIRRHTADRLQQERNSLLTQRDSQQGAACARQAELQHWQDSREVEVSALTEELQETKGRPQQGRATMEQLLSDLQKAQRQTRQAEDQASDRDLRLRGQEAELSRLRAVLQEAESRETDTEARLKHLGQSLDLYRTKYQVCLAKVSQQDSTLEAQDEDLKEARAQVEEHKGQVLRLRSQVAVLQEELKAHSAQLESGDDALSALSQRLRDAQRDREDSRKHSQECELVISTLRDSNATLRRQVLDQEECVVKIQADFSVYKATHIHSDSEYDTQLSRIQELQQVVERCAQGSQQLNACQSEVGQLRDEVSRLSRLKSDAMAELLWLQEARGKLQTEAVMEEKCRLQELEALGQRTAKLEEELQAAQRLCAQRQQEADPGNPGEALRSRAVQLESQAAAARGLEADIQRARKEAEQRDAECGSLRTQLMTLREELKEAQGRCRDTAQELARQEEKVLLVEGGQHRAQEQLAQRVAEVVRAEQTQRKQQAELCTLQQRLTATELEIQAYRTQVEVLQKAAGESRQAQIRAQQEASTQRQVAQQLEAELTTTKDTLRTLQQQLQEQADASQALRAELTQEQARQQECMQRLTEREAQMKTERVQLRTNLEKADRQLRERERSLVSLQERMAELQSAAQSLQEDQTACQRELDSRRSQSLKQSQELAECISEAALLRGELAQLAVEREGQEERARQLDAELHRLNTASRQSLDHARSCEGRLAELSAQLARSQCWGQEQLVALEAREEEMVLLKVEVASFREKYQAKFAQVEALQSQLHSTEQQYTAASNEVELLRQSLGNARSDSFHLHRESNLVVTNLNQWVKMQKQGNEKLNLTIKSQKKTVIHLTAEKDHLQERVEALQREVGRLKSELDDSRMDAERFRASQARMSDRCSAVDRLPVQTLLTEDGVRNKAVLPGASSSSLWCQSGDMGQ
ncbi:hypothetical protein UPYG_G00083990 [Umbra pygmaea]|uniref:Polyamine-modulated factor 1-binding protein 1 n=1 Tax=Umbra pygmaea TaxID=75934 RepID=A0ABD0XEB7_UMBPY